MHRAEVSKHPARAWNKVRDPNPLPISASGGWIQKSGFRCSGLAEESIPWFIMTIQISRSCLEHPRKVEFRVFFSRERWMNSKARCALKCQSNYIGTCTLIQRDKHTHASN